MDLETPLRSLVTSLGLELYDVEFAGGTLTVTVDQAGGVDLAALERASQAVSAWLDEHDPIPTRYTLDVASPGLERKLRTPAHYAGALGETVTLRERRGDEPTRRLEGELIAADQDHATLLTTEGPVTVAYADVERARTVFQWGSGPQPSPSRGRSAAPAGRRK